ncbi:MAG: pyrophosphatase [Rubrivivax sp.]|nr:MAG: pyrophosphatase [Rubrivivax sp.]
MTKESIAVTTGTPSPPAWRNHVHLPEDIRDINALMLADYQRVAQRTDKLPAGIDYPILGLFGETGGLLAVLKKRAREGDSFSKFHDGLLEEFGDVLWYLSTIASRYQLNLAVLAQRLLKGLENWDDVDEELGTFFDVQSSSDGGDSPKDLNNEAAKLAGAVGELLNDFRQNQPFNNRDRLSSHLLEIFRHFVSAADAANICLNEVAASNLYKIFNRWPENAIYPPRIDNDLEVYEKFPPTLDIYISEEKVNGRLFVFQRCNGIYIGDRLTDNKQSGDDYRFHDVFHLSFAVHLGWSPVLRALLHLKRKSLPDVDENQDGARAILIEEGIATFIFERGLRAGWDVKDVEKVDFDLLKYVTEFVRGYEAERCCMWQWELAIIDAFNIFRALKRVRKGWIHANLDEHTLSFRSEP